MSSLIADLLRQTGGTAVIDGGLATELERHGADLNDPLWSAKCLFSSPHLIRQVHSPSFRFKFVHTLTAPGDYGDAITVETLKRFHRRRVQILADSGADLLAFETVPNKLEAESIDLAGRPDISQQRKEKKVDPVAYAQLLKEEDIKIPAWFSFNSKDGVNVVSGDSLMECGSIAESCNKVVAVGINCTPPRFIHGLIVLLKKVTTKPIVIYPNSGETYDADLKEWVQNTGVTDEDFISYVSKWCELGASLVGGCCRTTPATIRKIYSALSSSQSAILATK
ncbi:hypothetical protein Fmac_029950 [Flemingia macrophylla]|uniref:Hcy-binding domain-containing protein n=1 Tax=Flemingia macrophylla TaxID=520843 RepID=A0ABD1LBS6_9FABA